MSYTFEVLLIDDK